MASKTINTILNLKDNMSGKMVKTSSKVAKMSKEAQKASRQVATMANTFKKKVDEMSSKAVKFAGVGAAMAGAFALKTGLSEALDLEGFKMQLETATKDTVKAGKIMSYAIDLANKTPFEGAELVSGAAKFEAMGMSAEKWLTLAGDMAAATNKGFDQSVEALIDAQTGELERMKEFGITKAMIAEKSAKMFSDIEVINNKGQIVNQEKFNEAMISLMEDKYVGGMEKQAGTLKGIWSTVTGTTKSALSNMVGMMNDGTIKQGSLLDKLKEKISAIADRFDTWQKDGTLQRLTDKFNKAFTFIYNVVSKFVNFLAEHKDIFIYLGSAFAGLALGIKVVGLLSTAMKVLQIVWALFNGTLTLSPMGWVVIGVTALTVAGTALWKNWDTVSSKISKVWDMIENAFTAGVNWCIDKINWLIEKINKIPGVNVPLIAKVGYEENQTYQASPGGEVMSAYATGTSYAKGGLTRINERGGELAIMPSGSKVIPADKTDKLLNNNGISISVIVQGNVIGNDEFINQIGSTIATRVKGALVNM